MALDPLANGIWTSYCPTLTLQFTTGKTVLAQFKPAYSNVSWSYYSEINLIIRSTILPTF